MSPYIAEFIGTALLVLLGNGAVANVLLARTKGKRRGSDRDRDGLGDGRVHRRIRHGVV